MTSESILHQILLLQNKSVWNFAGIPYLECVSSGSSIKYRHLLSLMCGVCVDVFSVSCGWVGVAVQIERVFAACGTGVKERSRSFCMSVRRIGGRSVELLL